MASNIAVKHWREARAAAVQTMQRGDRALGQGSEYAVIDRYGRILHLGAGLTARLAFGGERLLGRRLVNRVPAESRSEFMRALNGAHATRTWGAERLPLRSKVGLSIDARVASATFLCEPEGAIVLQLEIG